MRRHARRSMPSPTPALAGRPAPRGGPAFRVAAALITVALCAAARPAPPARADAPPVALVSDLPSGQLAGTMVTWSAAVAGGSAPVYRFRVGPQGGTLHVLRDFSPTPTFSWTPLQEGAYDVEVTARDGYTGTVIGDATASFTVASRVTGTTATVALTANPLVALYSAPPCADGQAVVRFRPAADPSSPWSSTAAQPCRPGLSINILVAGMRPATAYLLQLAEQGTAGVTISSPLTFTTGSLPSGLAFPSFTVRHALAPDADTQASVVFHALAETPVTVPNPLATDLDDAVVWYYDPRRSGLSSIWATRPISGGGVLLLGRDDNAATGFDVLREIELAGDTVRETSVGAVDAQLAARGQGSIYGFHHEALRLPDGDTAVLAHTQRTVGGRDVMGDMLVVLDADFQVAWAWDAFDYLDPNRHGILADTCASSDPGFCDIPDPQSEDWLHTNSVGWSPADDDLTLSLRHQDWVIKIDYRDGAGDGHVVWRLGQGGDFSIASTDPYPWFSHQHDAHYIDATTMVLFDNGNTRCQGSATPCDSRGQVLSLDEQGRVATPLLNADLGDYSAAVGSAERLANGDYAFGSGLRYPGPTGQSIEVRPDGSKVYAQEISTSEYRSYRLDDLYSAPDSTPSAGPPGNSAATPEIGSGELLATGLLPLGLALVVRRRRARRTTRE